MTYVDRFDAISLQITLDISLNRAINACMTPAQQNPLLGVFWMLLTGLSFIAVTALVKVLGTRIPAPEAAFLRYLLGLVFLIPFLGSLREIKLDRATWRLFGWRGLAHTLAVSLWFFAMARIPIADVTAMNYLSPIYVTIGAALFLGERLALRRIIAVLAALLGALIILRPGIREVGPGHIAMIFTAMLMGASYLMAKMLSDRCSAGVVVAMLSISCTIGLLPLAALNWVTPTWWELLILMGVATAATAGHYTMTLAFRAAPLTVTQPVTFLQLVWAVTLGITVFGEPLDPYVILGGTIIVGSVCFISWREAVLKRKAITPNVTATKV